MNYRIKWEIDVTADDFIAAAREALAMQRDPHSTATVFDVTPLLEHSAVTPPTVRVDLMAVGETAPPTPPALHKQLYTVIHTHRHGTSVYLIQASAEPTQADVITALDIDFEPEREESIEIVQADKNEPTDIDAAPVLPAPAKTPLCPKCNSTSITIHVDAEATYELKGWDKQGEIVADFATPADVHTYDERKYICDECSYESSDAADFQAA